MAKQEADQYKIIKGMEVMEFFTLFELYRKELKNKVKNKADG